MKAAVLLVGLVMGCGGRAAAPPPAPAPPAPPDAAPAPDAVDVEVLVARLQAEAQVVDDTPEAPGTAAGIHAVVRAALPTFRACYVRELATAPALRGRVEVGFTIGADGRVVDAVASGLGATLEACLVAAMRALVFAPPQGGGEVKVRYPFTFAPP